MLSIVKSSYLTQFSAPPIPVGRPRVIIGDNYVNISWEEANKNNSLDEEIFYDVECLSCEKMNCNTSCHEEQYEAGQNALNQTMTIVHNLAPSRCYLFRIYPRNALNNVIPIESWNFYQTSRFCIPNESNVSMFKCLFTFAFYNY